MYILCEPRGHNIIMRRRVSGVCIIFNIFKYDARVCAHAAASAITSKQRQPIPQKTKTKYRAMSNQVYMLVGGRSLSQSATTTTARHKTRTPTHIIERAVVDPFDVNSRFRGHCPDALTLTHYTQQYLQYCRQQFPPEACRRSRAQATATGPRAPHVGLMRHSR